MATTNYNLPTISDNMAADVVRDHNALAEAVDTAVKTVENGVNAKTQVATTAEAQDGTNNTKVMTPLRVKDSILINAFRTSAGTDLDPNTTTLPLILTDHPNVQSEGSSTLWYVQTIYYTDTSNRTQIATTYIGLNSDIKTRHYYDGQGWSAWSPSLQGLKSSVSNGKAQVAAAITGKGVSTAADASFATLVSNITAIQTGPHKASGTVAASSTTNRFILGDGTTSIDLYFIEVTGLNFKPKTIRAYYTSGSSIFTVECREVVFNKCVLLANYTNASSSATNLAVSSEFPNVSITNTGFKIPVPVGGINNIYSWEVEG